jgi:riboflavin-specific deaminase-like protein
MNTQPRSRRAGPRPFVLVNMAMSADGKIASANRAVTTFGSARDLAHLYELRATADAILSGARTIEETGATLGPGGDRHRRRRLRDGRAEFPLRVIASGRASIDPASPIFHRGNAPIVLLTTARAPRARLRRLGPHLAGVIASGDERIDFAAALAALRKDWGVRRLLCEGGGELNDALFRAGLVDELHLTVCPLVIGGNRAPSLADGAGCARLADAAPLRLHRARRIGDEMFFTWRAAPR